MSEVSLIDSAAAINETVDSQLQNVASYLNSSDNFKCERARIKKAILYELDKNFSKTGNLLRHASPSEVRRTTLTPQSKSPVEMLSGASREKSIYGKTNIRGCCASRINVGGVLMGVDKVDHFLGNGGLIWDYYEGGTGPTSKPTDAEALLHNVHQEHVGWGLTGSYVKSYGDLSANWAGFGFYKELLDGPKPYLTCKDGKVTVNRQFDIRKYVDASWNESINCSSFADETMAQQVRTNMSERGLKCPMDVSECKKLSAKYLKISKDVQQALLSPLCLNPNSKFSQVEEGRPHDWENVKNALKSGGAVEVGKILVRDKVNAVKEFFNGERVDK